MAKKKSKSKTRKPKPKSKSAPPSAEEKKRARTVLRRLRKGYPDAKCSLDFESPLQLLVATILSAQCTDVRVNKVTPALFERFPDVEAFAGADIDELKELIRSTGFFNNKAKSILGMAKAVMQEHAGNLPDTREKLVKLAGVGRKTANVVLGNAFDKPALPVDTHVKRISRLLGFTTQEDPDKIEFDLNEMFPKKSLTDLGHLIIHHGRAVCIARRPRCEECTLADLCPSAK